MVNAMDMWSLYVLVVVTSKINQHLYMHVSTLTPGGGGGNFYRKERITFTLPWWTTQQIEA